MSTDSSERRPDRRPECILHVGTEKTGTTTVQAMLAANRDRLADRGVLVPRSAADPNHWGLAVAAYNDDRRDDLTTVAGIDDAPDRAAALAAHRRGVIDGVRRELQAAGPGIERVVFSSEHLQSRLTTDGEIERLARILSEMGLGEVTVVVYLRNPVTLAASLHSTLVKHGAASLHPPPPTSPYFNRVCNHRATLEQFGAVFGADRIVPRIFAGDRLIEGSVEVDFAETIGLGGSADLELPNKPMNRSLSAVDIALLARINAWLSPPIRVGLSAFFEQVSVGRRYQLDTERAAVWDAAFAESNRWVADHYFGGTDHLFFTHDSTMVEAHPKLHGLEMDVAALTMTELWLDRKRAEGVEVDADTDRRLAEIRAVLDSGLWDPDYYVATNPKVAAGGVVPITHFLRRGGQQGRSPSAYLDVGAYVAEQSGAVAPGFNPLLHYLGFR